jgi:hypothetical protein
MIHGRSARITPLHDFSVAIVAGHRDTGLSRRITRLDQAMQPTSDDRTVALSALRAADLGPPLPQPGGLAVRRVAAARHVPPTLHWSERDPPDPGHVTASNPGPDPARIPIATPLDGGLTARAVAGDASIDPGDSAVIPTIPLGARWWHEGPVLQTDSLPPVMTALVFQAVLGDPHDVATARARTRLRSHPGLDAAPLPHPGTGPGWALFDAELTHLIAAWLAIPTRAPRIARPPAWLQSAERELLDNALHLHLPDGSSVILVGDVAAALLLAF